MTKLSKQHIKQHGSCVTSMNSRLITLIFVPIFVLLSLWETRAGSQTNAYSNYQNWIYYQQLDVYVDLLSDTNLPAKDLHRYRQKAYNFFFRYWILYRSQFAHLSPNVHFERDFALLLRKYDMPFIDQSDPLGIKSHYKEGKFVPKPLPNGSLYVDVKVPESFRLPHVDWVPSETWKTWRSYQEQVHHFRQFIVKSLTK